MHQTHLYYSLDIETSGFDPETNEILEVGLAGFYFAHGRMKIVEKWSKVFRSSGPVSAHVLGLTGISQAELDGGAEFRQFREFLQDKLGNAPIVGHNVGFDVGFLQKYGLTFSGPVIDTMDLVQFLLPTHHSYNLENLMHTFGISHKEAHRALPDALACARLVESLLGVYQGLPGEARTSIELLARQAGAPWLGLLAVPARPTVSPVVARKVVPASSNSKPKFILKDKMIYTAALFEPLTGTVKQLVETTNEPLLVVVPKRFEVLELWRQGLVRGLFEPRLGFDREKFGALVARAPESLDEAKFLMKLTVWQATSWQAECMLDLNFSFFGGQFKELVAGRDVPEGLPDRVLCCDHQTFLALKGHSVLQGRSLVVFGMPEFERAITATLGERSSWGYINFVLRSIYDPETSLGRIEEASTVIQLLADSDLFFGLSNALLLKFGKGWGEVKVDEYLRNSAEYIKILQAAEHFVQKLAQANKLLRSKEVTDFQTSLARFFVDEAGLVKWISFGERACSFHSLPLKISGIVQEACASFKKISIVELGSSKIILGYFKDRLGWSRFSQQSWVTELSWYRKYLQVFIRDYPRFTDMAQDIRKFLKQLSSSQLPAAVVLDAVSDVAGIYKDQYQELKARAFLLVEQQGGGTNKLFRNFSIHKNSLLLVSSKAVLTFFRNPQQVKPVTGLSAKTLLIAPPASNITSNPYIETLAQQYKDPESEFYLPQSLYDFQTLLQFFHSNKLKCVYLLDTKNSAKNKGIYEKFVQEVSGSR